MRPVLSFVLGYWLAVGMLSVFDMDRPSKLLYRTAAAFAMAAIGLTVLLVVFLLYVGLMEVL